MCLCFSSAELINEGCVFLLGITGGSGAMLKIKALGKALGDEGRSGSSDRNRNRCSCPVSCKLSALVLMWLRPRSVLKQQFFVHESDQILATVVADQIRVPSVVSLVMCGVVVIVFLSLRWDIMRGYHMSHICPYLKASPYCSSTEFQEGSVPFISTIPLLQTTSEETSQWKLELSFHLKQPDWSSYLHLLFELVLQVLTEPDSQQLHLLFESFHLVRAGGLVFLHVPPAGWETEGNTKNIIKPAVPLKDLWLLKQKAASTLGPELSEHANIWTFSSSHF